MRFMLSEIFAALMASFKIKLLAIIVLATGVGELVPKPLAQASAANIFQHPAVVAGIVGGTVAILMKLADMWWDARKQRNASSQREVISADKVAELSKAERAELREGMAALHAKELLFWQQQLQANNLKLAASRMAEAEARIVGHTIIREVMKLQSYIISVMALVPRGVKVPPIQFRDYNQLVKNAREEIEAAKREIRESGEIHVTFNQ